MPEVLQNCEELQKWLSSCSGDIEDNTFSEEFDELEHVEKESYFQLFILVSTLRVCDTFQ